MASSSLLCLHMRSRSPALPQCVCTPCTTDDSPHRRVCNSANCEPQTLPVALDEQLIPLRSSSRPLRELLSQLPILHIMPHLCSKSAFDVCKRACSARASSCLTSKESALLWQDRRSSHFISKTFSRLAQIHGSLFILAGQSTKLLAAEDF